MTDNIVMFDPSKATAELNDDQYNVLAYGSTEPPFSGNLLHNTATGVYACAGCGNELFDSEAKFDSGSGWPSFIKCLDSDTILLKPDHSHDMIRTEVLCAFCGGHLGHLFDDGPEPTGKRFCINSLALRFIDEKKQHE